MNFLFMAISRQGKHWIFLLIVSLPILLTSVSCYCDGGRLTVPAKDLSNYPPRPVLVIHKGDYDPVKGTVEFCVENQAGQAEKEVYLSYANISDQEVEKRVTLDSLSVGKVNFPLIAEYSIGQVHIFKINFQGASKARFEFKILCGGNVLKDATRIIEFSSTEYVKHEELMREAVMNNKLEEVEKLISQYPPVVNCKINDQQDTPLHWAVRNNKQDLIKCLLKHGADLNLPDKVKTISFKTLNENQNITVQETPLMVAISMWRDNPDLLKLLLLEGKKINLNTSIKTFTEEQKVKNEFPLLLWAMLSMQAGAVELLLEKGVDMSMDVFILAISHWDEIPDISKSIFTHYLSPENKRDINAKINDNGQGLLHWAVQKNRKDLLESLLDKGAKVDLPDNYGNTPLKFALDRADWDRNAVLLNTILSKGKNIDINAKVNGNGEGLLHWAVQNNKKDLLESLLDKDAKVDLPDNDGNTPLSLALDKADWDIDAVLLNTILSKGKNIDINAKVNGNGEGLLHWALKNNRKNLLESLLDKGAKVDLSDNNGDTPLSLALDQWDDNPKLLETILSKGKNIDINAKVNGNGEGLLHWALKNNRKNLLESLLDKGAKVDLSDNDGNTPLKFALDRGGDCDDDAVLLNTILSKGKNIDINAKVNDNGQGLLHWAVENNRKDLLESLLDKGAKVDLLDNDGNTPLSLTVNNISSNWDILKLLLEKSKEKGVNVNSKIKYGNNNMNTLLHSAVWDDRLDIVKLLLTHGADLTIPNSENKTSLGLAFELYSYGPSNDLLNLLLTTYLSSKSKLPDIDVAINDNGETWLHWAVKNSKIDLVKLLLNKGAKVDLPDHDGNTPLSLASGTPDTLKMLLGESQQQQIDVNFKIEKDNGEKENVLCWAIENDNTDLVKLLLKYNVDVDIKGAKRNSGWELAISQRNRHPEMLSLLLFYKLSSGRKFDVNGEMEVGYSSKNTFLDWTIETGQLDLVKILLAKGANLNVSNADGLSPWDLAVKNRNAYPALFMYILKEGKDIPINAKLSGCSGQTLLHFAVRYDKLEMVNLLVGRGADVTLTDDNGNTPLKLAIEFGYEREMLSLLKKK